MVRIRMIFKPMIGNALHYCNCHGTGCNKVSRHKKKIGLFGKVKDWTSAEGGNEQTTPAAPDDTIKQVFLFLANMFLYVFDCLGLYAQKDKNQRLTMMI